MTDGRTIEELLRAYREHDPEAEQELLTRLEPLFRGLVRKLVGKQIRSERESMDICQSLMLAFHMQAADGRLDLRNEKALRGYLAAMIRHKLANLSDRIRAEKRGGGKAPVRIDGEDEEDGGTAVPAFDPTASMVVGTAEILRRIKGVLSSEEIRVLEGRLAGRSNREIGEKLGKSPDAVRMIWNRAREELVKRGVMRDPD